MQGKQRRWDRVAFEYVHAARLAVVLLELHGELRTTRITRDLVKERWLDKWPRHAALSRKGGRVKPKAAWKIRQGTHDLRVVEAIRSDEEWFVIDDIRRLQLYAKYLPEFETGNGVAAPQELRRCSLDLKVVYPDEQTAAATLMEIWGKVAQQSGSTRRMERRVYQCDHCAGWKLTSS